MNNFLGDSKGGLCQFLTIGSIDYTKASEIRVEKIVDWFDVFMCGSNFHMLAIQRQTLML